MFVGYLKSVATQPDTTTKHVRQLFETVATQRDTTAESSSTWLSSSWIVYQQRLF
jgi:hypothetical protein